VEKNPIVFVCIVGAAGGSCREVLGGMSSVSLSLNDLDPESDSERKIGIALDCLFLGIRATFAGYKSFNEVFDGDVNVLSEFPLNNSKLFSLCCMSWLIIVLWS
jgi:hypothetical protein